MTAKAAMIPMTAVMLAVLAGVALSTAARAEDDCLASPNVKAPAGSHWFYHTDPATERKCWSLKPQAQPAQAEPAQAEPAQAEPAQAEPAQAKPAQAEPAQAKPAQAKSAQATPARAKPTQAKPTQAKPAQAKPAQAKPAQAKPTQTQPAQAQASRAANNILARRVVAAMGVTDGGTHAGIQPNIHTATWTDPARSAGAGSFAWPDPPSPTVYNTTASEPPATKAIAGSQAATVSDTPSTATPNPPAQTVSDPPATATPNSPAQSAPPATNADAAAVKVNPAVATAQPASSATPTTVDQAASSDAPTQQAAADAGHQPKTFQHELPAAVKLAGLIVLLIVGMLMRRMLTKAFGQREKIRIERREPIFIESVPVKPSEPAQLAHSPALAPTLAPAHFDTDERIAEIEAVLSKLAQLLQPPDATLAKMTSSVEFTGAGARSQNAEIRAS